MGIWARPYLRAIDTTSRRLAVMKVSTAFWPSAASHSSSSRVAQPGATTVVRSARPGAVAGGSALLARDAVGGEQLLGHQAGLDGLGELDLGLGVQQGVAGDLVE